MADSQVPQVPWGLEALGGVVSEPAWRSKPTWYLLVTDDKMIPLPAQCQMAERARCYNLRSARQSRRVCLDAIGHGRPHHPSGSESLAPRPDVGFAHPNCPTVAHTW